MGRALVRRTPLLGAALLLTLGETASAQGTPTDPGGVPGATTTREETPGSQDEADAATSPTAPDEASTPQEPTAPGDVSTPQEPTAPADVSTPVQQEGTAEADSCETPASDEVIISDAVVASSSLSPEQSRALWPLSWKKSPGQGFSFGMEEGLWGKSWSQGLRVTIPFTRHLGTTLRGVYLIDMTGGPFTADAGGRLDFVGRSNALFNVVRLYGGGGVQVLAPVANTGGRSTKVGVGGHFGFEFFHNPVFSYFLEVGGQGGEPSPGATVVAGMMFYPWTR